MSKGFGRAVGAAAVMLALSAPRASAADWYTGPPARRAAVALAAPLPAWTGFYGGVNGGYAWSGSSSNPITSYRIYDFLADSVAPPIYSIDARDPQAGLSAATASGNANIHMNGGVAGGQIGYNYQTGGAVVGLEADIQGSSARGTGSFSRAAAWNAITDAPFALDAHSTALPLQLLPGNGLTTVDRSAASITTVSKRIDYVGTVRARVGYLALPSLLLYVTGGVAYGGVRATTTQSQTINNSISTAYCLNDPTCPASPGSLINMYAGAPQASLGGVGHYSGVRVGWTLGGGFEWLFTRSLSLKAEYLYFDLGSKSYASSPLVSVGPTLSWMPNPYTINQSVTRVRFNGDIFRLGVNYHFN